MRRHVDAGKCLGLSCPLCSTGDLGRSLNLLLGYDSQCVDKTCKNFNNCYHCRSDLLKLEDTFTKRREQESCVDGSCGDLRRCSGCESHILDSMVPRNRPDGIPGPLRLGDATLLSEVLSDVKSLIHNEYLVRLLRELQSEEPDAGEWVKTKEALEDGKCLGSACSLCGTATVAESLEDLSDNIRSDCGGKRHLNGNEFLTCLSCYQMLESMEDTLCMIKSGSCLSGRCGMGMSCVNCHNRHESNLTLSIERHQEGQEDETSGSDGLDMESCCSDEGCDGIETRLHFQHVQEMEKMKQDEQARHAQRMWRFERLGQCDGPDPDMPYGLGCRFLNCKRCGMIEARVGPKMRNDELRRHRAKTTMTSLNQGSNGNMIGTSRKRRFSNLDLHYPLSSDHILAKQIRQEKHRERLQRQEAHSKNERPSWFETPEDPLPDFWMGRPVLGEEEIKKLKLMDTLPRYYLSRSEEDIIAFNRCTDSLRLCTIIRRLEAELMSRDFWMQSLGYRADDGNGNFPAGYYEVEEPHKSAKQMNTTRVEDWLSDTRRS